MQGHAISRSAHGFPDGTSCCLQSHLKGIRHEFLSLARHQREVAQRGYDMTPEKLQGSGNDGGIIGRTPTPHKVSTPSRSGIDLCGTEFAESQQGVSLLATLRDAAEYDAGADAAKPVSLCSLALSVRIGSRAHTGVGAEGLYPFVRLRPGSSVFKPSAVAPLKPLRQSSTWLQRLQPHTRELEHTC